MKQRLKTAIISDFSLSGATSKSSKDAVYSTLTVCTECSGDAFAEYATNYVWSLEEMVSIVGFNTAELWKQEQWFNTARLHESPDHIIS